MLTTYFIGFAIALIAIALIRWFSLESGETINMHDVAVMLIVAALSWLGVFLITLLAVLIFSENLGEYLGKIKIYTKK